MFEPGQYRGQLREAVVTEAKSGNPQVVLTFLVTHCRVDTYWDELPKPESRYVYLALHGGAWPYAQAKLRLLGFGGDFANMRFAQHAYEGVELVCEDSEYDGRVFEKWDLANWHAEPILEPVSPDKLQELNAKWVASMNDAPSSTNNVPVSSTAAAVSAQSPTPF